MKLIMLPGMDGTGKLFQPLNKELPNNIQSIIISYPEDKHLDYKELETYVFDKLPVNEEFVLLAESFSGPIAYMIARRNLLNLKGIFFVATFLHNPNKPLLTLSKFISFPLLSTLPIPKWIIKQFLFGADVDTNCIQLFKDIINDISSDLIGFRIKEISRLSLTPHKIDIKAYYIQALNDKLVPSDNLNSFIDISDSLKILRIDGPHFILQSRPKECAKFITHEIGLLTSPE